MSKQNVKFYHYSEIKDKKTVVLQEYSTRSLIYAKKLKRRAKNTS